MSYKLVANTYFRSIAKLPDVDIERLEYFIRRLEQDPSNPGLGIEPVADAIDMHMWSARLGPDLRVIIHLTDQQLTLLYVDREAPALEWARRHRVCRHPETGRLQTVSIPPEGASAPVTAPSDHPLNFSQYDEQYLVRLGVPVEWLNPVRAVRDEASFWEVHGQLPEEVAELLYALALGEQVEPPKRVEAATGQLDADSQRRYVVIAQDDDLTAILTRPFEEWMLYLHPSQRTLVDAEYTGPAKVTGAAGTGKTVVAVHRAQRMAQAGLNVLLTTYTNKLRESMQMKVIRLTHGTALPGGIDVETTYRFALTLLRESGRKIRWIGDKDQKATIESHYKKSCGFDIAFVMDEWESVIAHHAILSWDEYREIPRVGRGAGLQPSQRDALWGIFKPALAQLKAKDSWTWGHICRFAREAIESGDVKSRYDAVVVDEVQDLSTQAIRFLAAAAGRGLSHFMIVGDAGQRIYPGGFSLRSIGIETRGRSKQLHVNYRTTYDIERAASLLRGRDVDDLEGDLEPLTATQSLLRGPAPVIQGFQDHDGETRFVADTARALIEAGARPKEIAVFARTWAKLPRFRRALQSSGIPVGDRREEGVERNEVRLSTMHSAKGLEFRYVFVVGCGDNVLPLASALRDAKDNGEREVALARERNLLYVSMTRARDQVWVSWTGAPSPFMTSIAPACVTEQERG